ncbi:DUF1566 domain-containing protein [Halorhodospira halochloris]|uniref:Lcl C-terminal domain-containing protein n=1 Tax=Halorhodospira halochloris TaxID=1052 RepID=UPI001EE7F65D|nr:DUF1566 domain-containing protein [Halorhodospira halochloris]MCG5547531.1 DUF1566 domain-containing protein [Halorhodospira halochloris]
MPAIRLLILGLGLSMMLSVLVGCDGEVPEIGAHDIDFNLDAREEGGLTVSWNEREEVSYSLIFGKDEGIVDDPANYATYDGEMVAGVNSPHELEGLESGWTYYVVLEVSYANGEHYPETASAIPSTESERLAGRYVIIRSEGGADGGIVKDVETDLQWMRCSLGQTWDGDTCTEEADWYDHSSAMNEAEEFNEAGGYSGHSDWRVPTREELRTLVYCSSGEPSYFNDSGSRCSGNYDRPAIYHEAFPNTPTSVFWSASPYAGLSDYAWRVSFYHGGDSRWRKSSTSRVRLVRGGQ